MAVPLALAATGLLPCWGTGVAGLSILPRYLTVPAVALCVFAGYALLGFTTLPERNRTWERLAIAAVVLGVAFVAIKAPILARLRDELTFVHTSHDDLVALLHTPAVQPGMR